MWRAAEESRTVVRVERQLATQPLRKVGIRNEVATECNQICIAGLQDSFGLFTVETAGCDNGARIVLANELSRNRIRVGTVVFDVAENAGLDEVQVREIQLREFLRNIREQADRIA